MVGFRIECRVTVRIKSEITLECSDGATLARALNEVLHH